MIIFRYLTKEIISTVIACTLVLLIIFVTNQFVHYLNDAANGKVTVHAVMLVMCTQVPMLLGYMLPLGLFLAILLTLGRLCADHEMVVLTSCGVSKAQLVGMVMLITAMVTALDAWLMLQVEPLMFRYRSEIVRRSVSTATLQKVLAGRFQNLGDDTRVFYVGKVNKAKRQFHDVFLAMQTTNNGETSHNPAQWSVMASEKVNERNIAKNGDFFEFDDGSRASGIIGHPDYKTIQYQSYWAKLPSPHFSLDGYNSAMKTSHLIALYPQDLHAAAELQWRFMVVLSTLVFALLAIPLSEVNPRKGKFAQLLPAVIIYVVYANLMFIAKSWVHEGKVSVFIGMWWIHILLLVLALFLYGYQMGWKRMRVLFTGSPACT